MNLYPTYAPDGEIVHPRIRGGAPGPFAAHPATPHNPGSVTLGLGFTIWAVLGLAFLALPGIVLTARGVVEQGSALGVLLAAAPVVVWVAVLGLVRPRRPLGTMLAIGAVYLALVVFVGQVWPPTIGPGTGFGDPSGLASGAQEVLERTRAALSSLLGPGLLVLGATFLTWLVLKTRDVTG